MNDYDAVADHATFIAGVDVAFEELWALAVAKIDDELFAMMGLVGASPAAGVIYGGINWGSTHDPTAFTDDALRVVGRALGVPAGSGIESEALKEVTKRGIDAVVEKYCFDLDSEGVYRGHGAAGVQTSIAAITAAKEKVSVAEVTETRDLMVTGLAEWTTSGSGTAEAFKTNYVDPIATRNANQMDALDELVGNLELVKMSVYELRKAVLAMIRDSKTSLDNYNPFLETGLVGLKITGIVLGLALGFVVLPLGGLIVGLSGVGLDIAISTVGKELEISGTNVAGMFKALRTATDGLGQTGNGIIEQVAAAIDEKRLEKVSTSTEAEGPTEADYIFSRPYDPHPTDIETID